MTAFPYLLEFEPLITGHVRSNRTCKLTGEARGHIDYPYKDAKAFFSFWSSNPSAWGLSSENVEEVEAALALIEEQRDRKRRR